MENILRSLGPLHTVLDLGCGGSSFKYSNYECRVLGVDVVLNIPVIDRSSPRFQYVIATSTHIPLTNASVDAVICNHTMEHFTDYKAVLREIGRVLGPEGLLWVSVPDGHGFDDTLYRLLYRGGGHVNRFTLDGLVADVEGPAGLRLIQVIDLFSGFVYVKRPLFNRTLNTVTRILDKCLGTRTSRYGWGFVFARTPVALPKLPSYFNVCSNCGCGQSALELEEKGRVARTLGLPTFECQNCGRGNVFFKPLPGSS